MSAGTQFRCKNMKQTNSNEGGPLYYNTILEIERLEHTALSNSSCNLIKMTFEQLRSKIPEKIDRKIRKELIWKLFLYI